MASLRRFLLPCFLVADYVIIDLERARRLGAQGRNPGDGCNPQRWPSVLMKVSKDSGTVSAGKFADIIAVKGDVLEHIDLLSRVDMVMKHGKRVK